MILVFTASSTHLTGIFFKDLVAGFAVSSVTVLLIDHWDLNVFHGITTLTIFRAHLRIELDINHNRWCSL